MNRRIIVPIALLGTAVLVGVALEATGRMGHRGGSGAAGGLGEYQGGCAGSGDFQPLEAAIADDKLMGLASSSPEGAAIRADGTPMVPNEYLIRLRDSEADSITIDSGDRFRSANQDLMETFEINGVLATDKLLARVDGLLDRPHPELDRTWRIRAEGAPQEVLNSLMANDAVEWAEPVIYMSALGQPNDPYYSFQWSISGLSGPSAWSTATGSGVLVAVVDTGVATGGTDGLGEVMTGYDFIDNDNNPHDENGHGTHVAGTIAQRTNNSIGVTGLAPDATILPVRVLDADGWGTNTSVASGIIWAVDNGAQVINLSLGGGYSETIANACTYASENGVVVVAATGNDSAVDGVSYPAALQSTIAVGATGLNHGIAYYSNRGPEVDLVAPGGDMSLDEDGDGYADGILQETLVDGYNYYFFQGTSMATPHAAAAAALLIENGITGVDDVRSALTETATDLGDHGHDDTFGNGLIDPIGALSWSIPPEEPVADLELEGVHVRVFGNNRAVVRWRTNMPSDTHVIGTNGYTRSAGEHTIGHRVLLRGRTGDTVTFTLTSENGDGLTVQEEIDVTFGI